MSDQFQVERKFTSESNFQMKMDPLMAPSMAEDSSTGKFSYFNFLLLLIDFELCY